MYTYVVLVLLTILVYGYEFICMLFNLITYSLIIMFDYLLSKQFSLNFFIGKMGGVVGLVSLVTPEM